MTASPRSVRRRTTARVRALLGSLALALIVVNTAYATRD